tara:strand:+ start:133 stop:372 length:240 start_codon:yes stop_codon:yes gene_type:complete
MTDPVIAQKAPFGVDVEEGKSYWWCSCGLSAEQPFCDGSHKGTGLEPMKYNAENSATIYFCGCKNTKGSPLCDGTHSKL